MAKIGLCGFTMAMQEYPRHFPVVEVQQIFYEPPNDALMRRWLGAMPPGFEFTLKAWQLITHESKSPTSTRSARQLAPCTCDCTASRGRVTSIPMTSSAGSRTWRRPMRT